MLILCVTGLPLIFHDEIDRAMGAHVAADMNDRGTPFAALDRIVDVAKARYPGRIPLFASQEREEDGIWFVTLGGGKHGADLVQVAVDAHSGAVLATPKVGHQGFMGVMFSLHVDLFAGLPGKLFLGVMGVMLLLSLVSGTVLYAPFMRKVPFAAVRRDRGIRIKWLDLHSFIGIATLTWAFVVGGTGVINTCSELLLDRWQAAQARALARPPSAAGDALVPGGTGSGSVQRAASIALRREPNLKIAFVAFPGSSFSTPEHFGIFMRGTSPLTSRLIAPVLIDTRNFQVSEVRKMPWYLTLLFISEPLHFGDYGGLPLKLIWALLDLLTVSVLGSGLYLWLGRRRMSTS